MLRLVFYRQITNNDASFKLLGLRPDLTLDRGGNRLLAGWARAKTLENLKPALEVRGIGLEEIEARFTSQNDPVTGDWGYRDKKYKSHIYFNGGATLMSSLWHLPEYP